MGLSRVAASIGAAAFLVPAADASGRDVLARARAWVDRYRPALSAFVAEEHYTQRIAAAGEAPVVRHLISDWALVRTDDGVWTGFRDVWSVDGVKVVDRRRRLDELVGRGRPDAATARQIIRESARYNVSGRIRDFNSPHIGLELLASSRDWCCRVNARPARAADPPQTTPGLDVRGSWLLDLRETGRPTIIRTPDNRPLRSRVRYRVNGATGAVRWYELEVGRPDMVSIAVTFAFDAAMGEWLPAGMVETFGVESNEERGEGLARYVNWRRFAVETRLLPVP